MRKLAPARVSYRHDFLISYRVYMMTGLFHISLFEGTLRGFIKVLNRRATEFDTQAKNWQGPEGLAPWGGPGACSPWKSLKFYSRRDVFSCILKLQTMTFNNQKR